MTLAGDADEFPLSSHNWIPCGVVFVWMVAVDSGLGEDAGKDAPCIP